MLSARLCHKASMAINRTSIAHLNTYPAFGIPRRFCAVYQQKTGLIAHGYDGSTRRNHRCSRQTKRFAQGLTLLLRGATSWVFIGLRQSSLMSLERVSIVL